MENPMALFAYTPDPGRLLAAIKQAIDNGHVKTWAYDKEGDFTHTPDQWNGKAWLRPSLGQGYLRFHIIGSKATITTWAMYGIYHGRFIEELITHFHDSVSDLKPTIQPLAGVDVCTTSGT
jgi:hypothetical protein